MSDTGAMQLARRSLRHSSQQGPQRRPAFRRCTLISLSQAELLEITQFADCEIDTHVTTEALWMELVKGFLWIFPR
jgi:hypothetical protein